MDINVPQYLYLMFSKKCNYSNLNDFSVYDKQKIVEN